jgi:hypothetical protein
MQMTDKSLSPLGKSYKLHNMLLALQVFTMMHARSGGKNRQETKTGATTNDSSQQNTETYKSNRKSIYRKITFKGPTPP